MVAVECEGNRITRAFEWYHFQWPWVLFRFCSSNKKTPRIIACRCRHGGLVCSRIVTWTATSMPLGRTVCTQSTSSCAVARCLVSVSTCHVVSYYSTIRRAQIFYYWLLRRLHIYRCVKVNSVLFVVVVHAAGCDKQDSLMRRRLWGKLHGGPSQLLLALQQSSLPDIGWESRFLPTPTAFDVRRVPVRILPWRSA